jgi:hypothetical protein
MIIILSTITYSAISSTKIRRLNKLYNDIRQLNDAVAVYYLKNNELPIDESKKYTLSKDATSSEINASNIKFVLNSDTFSSSEDLVNPNDYDDSISGVVYYKINAKLLDNLSLNYDGDFIVNQKSHMIYYLQGITVDNETYYSLPVTYRDVNFNLTHKVAYISNLNGGPNVNIYLPLGSKVDVKDYLHFNISNNTNDNLGQYQTLNISWINNASQITLENNRTLFADSSKVTTGSGENELKVEAVNYGSGDTVTKTNIYVYVTDVLLKDSKDNILSTVTPINLFVGGASKTVTIVSSIYPSGTAGNVTCNTEDTSILKINNFSNDNSSTKTGTLTGSEIGTTTFTISESNGGASKTYTINVYNFELYKESSKWTDLTFEAGETKTVSLKTLKSDKTADLTFGAAGNNNTVTWSVYANDGTQETKGSVVKLISASSTDNTMSANNEVVNDTVKIIAANDLKEDTTVTLKCEVKVDGEIVKTLEKEITVKNYLANNSNDDTNTVTTTNTVANENVAKN